MSEPLRLNCFTLDDNPRPNKIFPVHIAQTQTVGDLKEVIKDKNKHRFDGFDANDLELWKVDLPVDETIKDNLNNLTLDPMESLSPVKKLQKVFSEIPEDENLHIVIRAPPAVSSGPLHLKCFMVGDDPRHVFEIEIAPTESVSGLQKVIKDAKMRRLDRVNADDLKLWKVKINLDDLHLLRTIGGESVELKPSTKLSTMFTDGVDDRCVHVIVQRPAVARLFPIVEQRLAYLKKGAGTPSAGARPAAFSLTQDNQEYLCNRPREAANPVPVTLLEPIFAEFVDDCQNRQPTDHDNDLVWQLSETMCAFYKDELARMDAFRDVLCKYGIILDPSMVGGTKCVTDGHLLSSDGMFVQVILKGKNEIGSGAAEPFLEAMLYHRKFMEESKIEIANLWSVFPCIHIIVFGACIGFAGSVLTNKVQSEILGPIIPLFWHSTDVRLQVMAARTFGALKIAVEKLTNLYSHDIPTVESKNQCPGYPHPRSYINSTSTDGIQEFSYDETQILRDQLIFFGETVGDAAGSKICIKFVRHYSPEAHKFCAGKGRAPKLIAYDPLPGGWNMVVMDALDIDDDHFPQRPGSYRQLSKIAVVDRQPLKETITSHIQELHNAGYVHGDVRDANFVVKDNKDFMLLDFDWAGPKQETQYPIRVNRTDIRRPDGARDGEKISTEHDLEMLHLVFDPDGWKPPAKRRRVEGLAMTPLS
ncbi:uncharacterized protein HD556DRAFT_1526449 [Suillus plorans]|uniref:Crinkler effector protein N-terminal domain-containing protein n=1 Tax=Suillus plorans TaxID=116603 RepID=A0A9P7AVE3_9AGAM|nr:uncharacterized protein HD556DRAFT_1526449 [Suillus plorans]KAG1795979.1 hypothetical protein HD556DRAFT_1526449 [Suillus plorans]